MANTCFSAFFLTRLSHLSSTKTIYLTYYSLTVETEVAGMAVHTGLIKTTQNTPARYGFITFVVITFVGM